MKRKKNGLVLIILLIVCDIGLNAQNLYIRDLNGTLTTYALENIKKISFHPRTLEVDKTDGATEAFNMGAIRYLNFIDLPTGDEPNLVEAPQNSDFLIFPNPVKDIFTIQSFSSENNHYTFTILSTNGKIVYQEKVHNPGYFQGDLSLLANGIYFCRIISGEKVTVIKLVKN
ncbi:MAG: T9SS type A sorting domain-containing protein [Bacteroidales bacterium]|nr:T9SS type A sorting domain-containing protein [Bacteroidales bacterium]